jgi:integrase
LAANYFGSAEFLRLPAPSQANRRRIIEGCLREPLKPKSPDKMALCPLPLLSSAHIRMLRDRRADAPGAANNRLKYLGSMFSWAIENNLVRSNPARDVKPIRYATDGFHSWTPDEVKQFETHHNVGSKPRLALALMLYLGVRRGDVVLLGRQHVRDGVVRFVPSKTRHRKKHLVEIPLLPELERIIASTPTGDLTFLVTAHGRAFTAAGFGNWFRRRCNEAGLSQCSAHGLRKAAATLAAERGATDRQLMALFGWESSRQATTYTAAADRRRLAAAAVSLIGNDQTANTDCPTKVSHPKKS